MVRMPVTLRPIGRFSEMSLKYKIASIFLTMIYRTGVGMGREAWRAAVHGATKSWTGLSD